MRIGHIENGSVLDHITAGNAMNIYKVLKLGELDCTVALIKNADSPKMGKKDIVDVHGVAGSDVVQNNAVFNVSDSHTFTSSIFRIRAIRMNIPFLAWWKYMALGSSSTATLISLTRGRGCMMHRSFLAGTSLSGVRI